jgi:tetratricopeptide (TPR) repeat protein
LLESLLSAGPETPIVFRFTDAVQSHKRGLLADAETKYRDILDESPEYVPALHNLGALLLTDGRHGDALVCLRDALRVKPRDANIHSTCGAALLGLGDNQQALQSFLTSLNINPNNADALCNAGIACQRLKYFTRARNYFDKSLELSPKHGNSLINSGLLHLELGRDQIAVTYFDRALALFPASATALIGKSNALRNLGQYAAALECLDDVLERSPGQSDARINRATLNLLLGNFAEGWQDFEARLDLDGWNPVFTGAANKAWRGEALAGKTILLSTEQGAGDAFQAIRFAQNLSAQGAVVQVAAPESLRRILATAPGVSEVITSGNLPPHDYWAALFSLPGLLNVDHRYTSTAEPYLFADVSHQKPWLANLAPLQVQDRRLRVGLVRAGNPDHQNDDARSIDFETLLPLLSCEDVQFCSLQVGETSDDFRQLVHSGSSKVIDFSPHLEDYADTAAAISDLDLIISVDTSAAHLAAAMGKPVWLLIAKTPDWRWQSEGTSTRWYPTMKIFRQTTANDWPNVIQSVLGELEAYVPVMQEQGEPGQMLAAE